MASREAENVARLPEHEGYVHWVGQRLDTWEDLQLEPERIEPVGEHHE